MLRDVLRYGPFRVSVWVFSCGSAPCCCTRGLAANLGEEKGVEIGLGPTGGRLITGGASGGGKAVLGLGRGRTLLDYAAPGTTRGDRAEPNHTARVPMIPHSSHSKPRRVGSPNKQGHHLTGPRPFFWRRLLSLDPQIAALL